MWCGVLSCDELLCDVLLCDVLLCDELLCDVLLCDVLLWCIVMWRIVKWCIVTALHFTRISEECSPTSFDNIYYTNIQCIHIHTHIQYICIHRGIYILSSKYVESQLWPFGGSYPIFKHSRHIVNCDPHFCWLNPFTSNLSTDFLMVCWVWAPINSPRLVVPSPQEMVMVSKCIWMIYKFNHIYVKCAKCVVERILKYVCGGGFWCLFCSFPQQYAYIYIYNL